MAGNRCTIFLLLVPLSCCLGAILRSPTPTPTPTKGTGTRSRIAKQLGDACDRDDDCESSIVASQCHRGYCRCLPYFARYNGTRCLEATLLGEGCVVEEQCSLKVANSGCYGGVCGCRPGFLQFRRHTCLAPAKLGDICYEHAHCRLWQAESHCDFFIPDLFGRCQCTAPMRRDNGVCRPDDLVRPPPLPDRSPAASPSAEAISPTEHPTDETGVETSWLKNRTVDDSTGSSIGPAVLIPVNLVTGPSSPRTTDRPESNDADADDDDDEDAVVIEASTENATTGSEWGSGPTKTDRREGMAVSLGLDCASDFECRSADPYSRCIDGACECGFQGNSSCSAKNRGCAAGTFQCRSSGICISWFFVCDGRPDCGDGSDERCSSHGRDREEKCPEQAFRCADSELCVSRASVCDGRRDCPRGEDENGCNDRRRCPEGAFRCNNGQCLPAYEFCNAVVSCRDGSDEPRGACRMRNRGRITPSSHCPFRCDNGRCRSDAIACSGRDGCGDNSDERRCSVCKCSPFP